MAAPGAAVGDADGRAGRGGARGRRGVGEVVVAAQGRSGWPRLWLYSFGSGIGGLLETSTEIEPRNFPGRS
jgi:hypothetical protein